MPGKDVRTEASMVKLYGTEMATETIDHAMQTFGAMGVAKELPLQLMMQTVRTMRVYEGPSEVHRMVIARRIIGRERCDFDASIRSTTLSLQRWICYCEWWSVIVRADLSLLEHGKAYSPGRGTHVSRERQHRGVRDRSADR